MRGIRARVLLVIRCVESQSEKRHTVTYLGRQVGLILVSSQTTTWLKQMTFFFLPFALAANVIGDNDSGYIAACIRAGLIG